MFFINRETDPSSEPRPPASASACYPTGPKEPFVAAASVTRRLREPLLLCADHVRPHQSEGYRAHPRRIGSPRPTCRPQAGDEFGDRGSGVEMQHSHSVERWKRRRQEDFDAGLHEGCRLGKEYTVAYAEPRRDSALVEVSLNFILTKVVLLIHHSHI